MYKIIGGDQKEYGPVSADDLRQWIGEGRLNAQSLAQAEGSTEWKPLGAFPEFAAELGAQVGNAAGRSAAPPPIDVQGWSERMLAREPRVEIGRCLSRSFSLFAQNFGLLCAATLAVWFIGLIQFVPFVSLLYTVLWGALFGGFFLVFLKRIRGEPATLGGTFSGFGSRFGQLALAGFISALLAGIGMFFCFIPGIYLTVIWAFSVPLVADKGLDFWPAMELSRKVVNRVWFEMFGLLLLAFLPFVVLWVFTRVKFGMIMFSAVYPIVMTGHADPQHLQQVMMHSMRSELVWSFITDIVLLLNFPFAVGALMYAYEDLFGTRPPSKP